MRRLISQTLSIIIISSKRAPQLYAWAAIAEESYSHTRLVLRQLSRVMILNLRPSTVLSTNPRFRLWTLTLVEYICRNLHNFGILNQGISRLPRNREPIESYLTLFFLNSRAFSSYTPIRSAPFSRPSSQFPRQFPSHRVAQPKGFITQTAEHHIEHSPDDSSISNYHLQIELPSSLFCVVALLSILRACQETEPSTLEARQTVAAVRFRKRTRQWGPLRGWPFNPHNCNAGRQVCVLVFYTTQPLQSWILY